MTSQTEHRIITTYLLLNISRTKDNQQITFCQLIEYKTRTTFIEKSNTKYDGEAGSRIF